MLTDLSFLGKGQQWPPADDETRSRLSDIEENRKLFEGKHDLVFKDWVRLLREDKQASLKIILNWHKRLSTLWADLLLGESPKAKAGDADSPQQQQVERTIEDNDLWNVGYQVSLDVSRYGTGVFKLRFDPQKGAKITAISPKIWFPIVDPADVKNTIAHVIAWDQKVADEWGMFGKKTVRNLHAEIHEIGKITYQTWKIVDGELDSVIAENVEVVNIDDFLVIPVHNLMTSDRTYGLNDYDDLDSIIQEMMIRLSQISRILDKHSDPNLAGPDTALELDKATGQYVFRGGGKYFPMAPGDNKPEYITWEGQLEAQYKELDVLMEQLYFLSETSPAAFGQLKSGLAESGSALRRLMMAPLAKVNRIRAHFDPAIREVIETASELESALGFNGAVSLEGVPITIEWQDGLPRDEQEVTKVEVDRYTSGLSSLDSSLQRLYPGLEGEALQHEIDEIKQERAGQQAPAAPKVQLPSRDGID